MADFKVPEAVLGAVRNELPPIAQPYAEMVAFKALQQYNEELIGDEPVEAAALTLNPAERNVRADMDDFRLQLQAAIDSMLGTKDGPNSDA